MFEEGLRLKAEFGAENVFDFSLGNPDVPPPARFQAVLEEEAVKTGAGLHGYMPNSGYDWVREAVAASYAAQTGLPFSRHEIIMSCGAGGGLNVVMKTLLDPGDEVILLTPYFVEYAFYVPNHGGKAVFVPTDDRFLPDMERIDAAITPRTKAVVINSPNNPTGVVYPRETLDALGSLLARASARTGRIIYLLSDEPYRSLVFDGLTFPSPLPSYENTIVVTSSSKDLSLAGERIGHIAISPQTPHKADIEAACTFTTRTLGFLNANALMQRVVGRLQGEHVNARLYEKRRNMICDGLQALGFQFVRPQGAFYLFPRSPIQDDVEFSALMRKYRVIVVPGVGFAGSGHFRISYAVPERTIERSLELFGKAADELGLRPPARS
jgi:aspartate aminotransferase